MALLDLLQIINENINVYIWLYGEVVAVYDGKNAIDSKYNDFRVVSCGVVSKATPDTMYIEIVEE